VTLLNERQRGELGPARSTIEAPTRPEHSGVTGKTPHQVARADSLRGITDADMVRGGINDLRAFAR
jgi:hypothetical protein